ncbi:MAG: hypothetical protein ABJD53_03925 [Gammaproteobacteria bacterium]
MEFGEYREVAALNERLRRVLSMFRRVAAHMAAHRRNSDESVLHLSGRIGAIGRAVLAPVSFDGMDLELLVRDELLLQVAHPDRFSISGTDVHLVPKSAEVMSLVIHELAINAVKYGALCQLGATIRVAWEIERKFGERILRFEWLEAGVRMSVVGPSARGFGFELVERLIARELKGKGAMTFLADGVRCRIQIPLQDPQPRHE